MIVPFSAEFTSNLLAPLAVVVYLFIVDWRVALLSLIPIVLGFSAMMGMFVGYEENFRNTVKCTRELNAAAVEYINGIEVIKAFGRVDGSYEKFTAEAILRLPLATIIGPHVRDKIPDWVVTVPGSSREISILPTVKIFDTPSLSVKNAVAVPTAMMAAAADTTTPFLRKALLSRFSYHSFIVSRPFLFCNLLPYIHYMVISIFCQQKSIHFRILRKCMQITFLSPTPVARSRPRTRLCHTSFRGSPLSCRRQKGP